WAEVVGGQVIVLSSVNREWRPAESTDGTAIAQTRARELCYAPHSRCTSVQPGAPGTYGRDGGEPGRRRRYESSDKCERRAQREARRDGAARDGRSDQWTDRSSRHPDDRRPAESDRRALDGREALPGQQRKHDAVAHGSRRGRSIAVGQPDHVDSDSGERRDGGSAAAEGP